MLLIDSGKLFFETTGLKPECVEIDPEQRELIEKSGFKSYSALEESSEKYDLVFTSNVLEHIENRVDFLKNIIKQIPWDRGLQKKILIRVPMVDRDWITIYKKQMGIECRLDKTHYTEYTYLQFKDELNKSNIEIVSHHIQYGELYAVCKAK